MEPEKIEQIANEIWESIQNDKDDFVKRFTKYSSKLSDENGNISQDKLIAFCCAFSMSESIKISYRMTVELLKKIL
jgi:hypothetical protein